MSEGRDSEFVLFYYTKNLDYRHTVGALLRATKYVGFVREGGWDK